MTKLLIAEDDKFLAKAYSMRLSKADFEVRLAENGNKVMEVLQEFTPDIILLDLIMPVKNGYQVLQELKNDDRYKNIPVIVNSSLSQPEDIENAKKAGADDYYVKSDLDLSQLISKINGVMEKRNTPH